MGNKRMLNRGRRSTSKVEMLVKKTTCVVRTIPTDIPITILPSMLSNLLLWAPHLEYLNTKDLVIYNFEKEVIEKYVSIPDSRFSELCNGFVYPSDHFVVDMTQLHKTIIAVRVNKDNSISCETLFKATDEDRLVCVKSTTKDGRFKPGDYTYVLKREGKIDVVHTEQFLGPSRTKIFNDWLRDSVYFALRYVKLVTYAGWDVKLIDHETDASIRRSIKTDKRSLKVSTITSSRVLCMDELGNILTKSTNVHAGGTKSGHTRVGTIAYLRHERYSENGTIPVKYDLDGIPYYKTRTMPPCDVKGGIPMSIKIKQ